MKQCLEPRSRLKRVSSERMYWYYVIASMSAVFKFKFNLFETSSGSVDSKKKPKIPKK